MAPIASPPSNRKKLRRGVPETKWSGPGSMPGARSHCPRLRESGKSRTVASRRNLDRESFEIGLSCFGSSSRSPASDMI